MNDKILKQLQKVIEEYTFMTDGQKQEYVGNLFQLIADIENNILKEYPEHIERLLLLDNQCVGTYEDIYKNNNSWIINNDARASVYGKFVSKINSTRIAFQLLFDFFNDENWIGKFHTNLNKRKILEQLNYVSELDTSLRFSFFQKLYANLESTVKIIVRYFDNIKNIQYNEDLKNFVIQNLKIRGDQDKFLKLIQWTRNAIHNNGLHYPDKIKIAKFGSFDINYKGRTRQFIYGKRLEFLDWNTCFDIAKDIIELTGEIINNPLVKNEILIQDPV